MELHKATWCFWRCFVYFLLGVFQTYTHIDLKEGQRLSSDICKGLERAGGALSWTCAQAHCLFWDSCECMGKIPTLGGSWRVDVDRRGWVPSLHEPLIPPFPEPYSPTLPHPPHYSPSLFLPSLPPTSLTPCLPYPLIPYPLTPLNSPNLLHGHSAPGPTLPSVSWPPLYILPYPTQTSSFSQTPPFIPYHTSNLWHFPTLHPTTPHLHSQHPHLTPNLHTKHTYNPTKPHLTSHSQHPQPYPTLSLLMPIPTSTVSPPLNSKIFSTPQSLQVQPTCDITPSYHISKPPLPHAPHPLYHPHPSP